MTKRIPILILFFCTISVLQCREKYDPPIIDSNPDFLVVDGILVGGSDSTKIFLSRTRKLSEGDTSIVEKGASVVVQDANGNTIYLLQELSSSPGTYGIAGMDLIAGNSYKLRIATLNGKSYISDPIIFKNTPVIDSVNWIKPEKDVTIYVNAKDQQNNTRYYRWQFEETWEYYSPYQSGYIYDQANDNVLPRNPDDSINHCWRTQYSKDLLIASTEKFSDDIVINQVVRTIPYGAFELGNKYSILVKQYTLNKEGFDYLQILKRVSEQSNSLFSAQPSQLAGNIHNSVDPNETVIGYITASQVSSKRIFIERSEVEPWGYSLACATRFVPDNPDSIRFYFQEGHYPQYIPLTYINGITSGYFAAESACTDCRILGGVTRKPDFWQ